jgi:hypothetical protein
MMNKLTKVLLAQILLLCTTFSQASFLTQSFLGLDSSGTEIGQVGSIEFSQLAGNCEFEGCFNSSNPSGYLLDFNFSDPRAPSSFWDGADVQALGLAFQLAWSIDASSGALTFDNLFISIIDLADPGFSGGLLNSFAAPGALVLEYSILSNTAEPLAGFFRTESVSSPPTECQSPEVLVGGFCVDPGTGGSGTDLPAPSTLVLLGLGFAGLGYSRRKKT